MIVLQENDGSENVRVYEIHPTQQLCCRVSSQSSWQHRMGHFNKVLADTFLPAGYPHSVRPEYLQYQAWDALQGLSSYLRSVLTTRSVLAGIGVGSAAATSLSAAMTWVLRDGCGMVGGLVIAYSCAGSFEVYVKEWRLFADFLNNLALTLDLMSSVQDARYYIPIVLLSTLSKAGCGLIAGATKTRISSHFALKGHLADVSAKESTQETAIALIGLVLGMLLARVVADSELLTWTAFLLLLLLHQYGNYRLIKTLVFHSLNPQRARIVTDMLLAGEKDVTPQEVAARETLLGPLRMALMGPRLGASIGSIGIVFSSHLRAWEGEAFFMTLDRSSGLAVCLQEGIADRDILRAFLMACYVQSKLSNVSNLEERQRLLMEELPRQAQQWCLEQMVIIRELGWEADEASALGSGSVRYRCKTD